MGAPAANSWGRSTQNSIQSDLLLDKVAGEPLSVVAQLASVAGESLNTHACEFPDLAFDIRDGVTGIHR